MHLAVIVAATVTNSSLSLTHSRPLFSTMSKVQKEVPSRPMAMYTPQEKTKPAEETSRGDHSA